MHTVARPELFHSLEFRTIFAAQNCNFILQSFKPRLAEPLIKIIGIIIDFVTMLLQIVLGTKPGEKFFWTKMVPGMFSRSSGKLSKKVCFLFGMKFNFLEGNIDFLGSKNPKLKLRVRGKED